MAAGAALRGLQEWCRRRTDGYPGVSITNMTSSFRDGLAFCAIIHHHRPDLIDFHSLKQEDVFENNNLAFSVAERELGIPALLEAEDMLAMRVPDRLSVITYVSQYYNYFNGRAPIGGATKRPSGPAESEPSTKKPTPAASAADKENVFKGNVAGAQRHSPARARPGGSLASIGEGSPAGFHAPPTVAVAAAPPVAQGSTCTMCGLRVHLVERHLVDGRLYHHNCFRCKECSNTLMPGMYKEGKEPGTYVCQHHRARSIYATTINAGTGTTTTTATTTTTGTAATTTTTGTAATTTTTGATSTTSSTSFLPSRLTSPSTASSRVTPGRDVPTIGKLNAAATPTISQPTTPSGREGRGIGATSPSPAARLTVSPVPETGRTSEARDTFFLSTPASGQTAPGWDRFEQKLPRGGSSDTPTSGRTGTPASPRLDKNRYEERDKAMENARQLLARRLPFGQSSTVAPTSNNLSPSSGKLSPTSRKRSPASGNLSATSGETPTVTPAGPTPIPLPRRTIPELVPSKWESSVSPVPKYTPSATPEKSPTRTRIGTGATSVSGGGGSSSSAGTSRSPVASLADSSVKTPGSIYADIVLRKATTPGQPAGFPEKSSASKGGAGAFGVKLRPTKSPTPVAGTGTTSTAGGTTPVATKAPSSTASGTTTFVPQSGRAQSVTVTVTIPVPEQPRPVDGGGHRSTAQWEVPASLPHTGPPGSAPFGHGDTKGRGGSPSKTAETPKKTWKKNPAPGYGYPPNRIPRRKPDTYMPPEQIQAELNSICLSLDEMQQRGVLLEAELRSCEGGDGEDELLVNWFRLIQEKNLLVRKESELAYVSKQQILEERQVEVEDQIRRIMGRPEAEKDRAHEQELLDELIEIVRDRNLIVENLERDRLRELEEDKALEDMLSTKDIFKSQEAKETGQETPKDTGKETPKDTGKETPKEKKERKRAEQEKKDLEKKEKIRAEKERRDQEKQERQRAEKERKEKEKQEKERQQKEKQEKEKQQKEKQEKEKQEKERQQKEKQEKEKQQKEKQEKEKQQKEKQEKSKKNKEKAENKKNQSDTLSSETENGKIEA
uniref:MICAL-like protein 1 isoform X1 n=1 Tax=Petromyzon marinus TaxID=7757 RepID=A0AAJ7XGW5_PETMA|nr:MICAL-like protein 1 isoform X1 [Petromyzon marinus]XP_032833885.1 MICAL-like protein 1 isoform X1 [Petromyzon marinus]XP_032833893.1 MICAL-like protein 1 isoform X1 [Petromyzon marinus]